MFSRSFLVSATILILAGVPAPVLALGGDNSGAPSSGGSAPNPVPTIPVPTPTTPAVPGLGDVPACAAAPAEGSSLLCGCASDAPGGSVWGTGPYTADSNICTAARHAGAIGPFGGVVRVTGLPGQASYGGSTANGVTTRSWGSFGASIAVEAAGAATQPLPTPQPATGSSGGDRPIPTAPQCTTLPEGADRLVCSCQASPEEARQSVWGSDPYTADSNICAAALHVGYINAGEPGLVTVLRLQGLDSYWGSENNGVTSQDWGPYGSSFVFDWNQ